MIEVHMLFDYLWKFMSTKDEYVKRKIFSTMAFSQVGTKEITTYIQENRVSISDFINNDVYVGTYAQCSLFLPKAI